MIFADSTVIQIDTSGVIAGLSALGVAIGTAITVTVKIVTKYLADRDKQQTDLAAQVVRVVDTQRADAKGAFDALLGIQKGTLEVLGLVMPKLEGLAAMGRETNDAVKRLK